jgi:hypothetical protein
VDSGRSKESVPAPGHCSSRVVVVVRVVLVHVLRVSLLRCNVCCTGDLLPLLLFFFSQTRTRVTYHYIKKKEWARALTTPPPLTPYNYVTSAPIYH